MSVYEKLKELDITLKAPAAPVAAYVMYVQTGNLVFISGHIAKNADGKRDRRPAGQGYDDRAGQAGGAQHCNRLDRHPAGGRRGDLNKVKRIVKLMSLVNSTPDYTEQHLVTNGCSELLAKCSATPASTRARRSAWPSARSAPASRST